MQPTRLARDDRRVQILRAVLPVVLERGIAATSKELAAAAGVSEGTIFKAFGDKESLLRALIEEDARRPDSAGDWLATEEAAHADLHDLVQRIATLALEQYTVQMRLFQMLYPLMQKPGEEHIERFEASLKPWVDALACYSDRLTIDAARAASMLRMLIIAGAQEGAWGIPMTAADITRVFLHGVSGQSHAADSPTPDPHSPHQKA